MPIVEHPTVPLTPDDLIQSGWREIVVPVIEKGYGSPVVKGWTWFVAGGTSA